MYCTVWLNKIISLINKFLVYITKYYDNGASDVFEYVKNIEHFSCGSQKYSSVFWIDIQNQFRDGQDHLYSNLAYILNESE